MTLRSDITAILFANNGTDDIEGEVDQVMAVINAGLAFPDRPTEAGDDQDMWDALFGGSGTPGVPQRYGQALAMVHALRAGLQAQIDALSVAEPLAAAITELRAKIATLDAAGGNGAEIGQLAIIADHLQAMLDRRGTALDSAIKVCGGQASATSVGLVAMARSFEAYLSGN